MDNIDMGVVGRVELLNEKLPIKILILKVVCL